MRGAAVRALQPLLAPESLVVIGASEEPSRIGGRPIQLAKEYGYPGHVVGVNPKYRSVQGVPCYPEVDRIPFVPDLAILAVGAKDVLPQLQACAAKGVRAAVVFAGGFAESATAEGRDLQARIAALAAASGMRIAGPNTIGLVNVAHSTYATFMTAMLERRPKLGEVALVAQSGGACIAVYNAIARRGVGFDYILSTGNEACVDFNDYLEYVAADPRTRVIAGYIEGLEGGPRFLQLMRDFGARRLPVALYKVGETDAGADAAASHTARIAGSHRVFSAALRQLGVMPAEDMEQLAELAYLGRFAGRTAGRRIGILTTSGAFAAILTDKFVGRALEVPALSEALQSTLRPHVPAFATVVNPVDITANVVNSPEGFETTLARMLATNELDMVVLFSTSNLIDRLAPAIVRAAEGSNRLLAVLVTGDIESEVGLVAAGVPVFHDTGRGAQALATFAQWHLHHAAVEPGIGQALLPSASSAVREAIEGLEHIAASGAVQLDEYDAKRLIKAAGIAVPEETVAGSAAEAAAVAEHLGWPVVMKILSPDIVHKTEIGGVRLGIADRDTASRAYAEILQAAAVSAPSAQIRGVLVQRQQAAGFELLLSCTTDPLFGTVLTVGFGGTAAELFGDVAQRLLPVNQAEAAGMLRELRMYPLLAGYRGAEAADEGAVVKAIVDLSALALAAAHQVREIEINPLIVNRRSVGGAVAVDCVVRLRHS
jgi:acyl-CoA synthetase (NDP forming)